MSRALIAAAVSALISAPAAAQVACGGETPPLLVEDLKIEVEPVAPEEGIVPVVPVEVPIPGTD